MERSGRMRNEDECVLFMQSVECIGGAFPFRDGFFQKQPYDFPGRVPGDFLSHNDKVRICDSEPLRPFDSVMVRNCDPVQSCRFCV